MKVGQNADCWQFPNLIIDYIESKDAIPTSATVPCAMALVDFLVSKSQRYHSRFNQGLNDFAKIPWSKSLKVALRATVLRQKIYELDPTKKFNKAFINFSDFLIKLYSRNLFFVGSSS